MFIQNVLNPSTINNFHLYFRADDSLGQRTNYFFYHLIIQRAFNAVAAAVEDVRVDHCSFYTLMAKQFLYGADIVAVI